MQEKNKIEITNKYSTHDFHWPVDYFGYAKQADPFIISFVFDHLTQYAIEILYSITTHLTEKSLAFTLFLTVLI